MEAQRHTFDSAERAFAALDRQRLAGEISDEAYRERLNILRVKDDEGHTWMLQERTGRWFVYRAGAWSAGTPPGRETSEPPGPPPAPDLTPPPDEVQWSDAAQPDPGALPDTRTLPPVPPPASESRPMPGVQPTLASAGLPPVPPPTSASSTPLAGYPPPPPPAAISPYPPPPPPANAGSAAYAGAATFADTAVDADMAEYADNAAYADTPAPSRKARRTGKSGRSRPPRRRGCVGITWSILKWELVWIAIAWFVYDAAGERTPWALVPVGLLAVITLLLWLRRIHPTTPQGA